MSPVAVGRSIPSVQSDYEAVGSYIEIANMTAYDSGSRNSKKAIICAYEFVGFHPNLEQICDLLAAQGYRVVMPDFFRGNWWGIERLRAEGIQAFIDWMNKNIPWENVLDDIQNVVAELRNDGAENFGILGLCWGGKLAVLASYEDAFTASVMIHPVLVNDDDAIGVQCPIAILLSKDEPDFRPFTEYLRKEPFGHQIIHKRFEDMPHGFASSQGDFSKQLIAKRVDEAFIQNCQHPYTCDPIKDVNHQELIYNHAYAGASVT
ncbi:hypothetical protein G9A89_001013 [Geosiphon pyriformis]|nr:hypothetical protein G9A89_001013 [Geosiphon pyriformis]